VIVIDGVSKSFDGVIAVSGLSLRVNKGEAVALVGPSGGGKTTALRLIAGFELPDEGTITIQGRLASRKNWACPPHERGIGMVFQKPALWPHMTLAQNIGFGISGMAALMALAPSPSILFLDEPMAGLDWDLVENMIELLHEVRCTTDVTLVYVSHHLEEARAVTDRVIVVAHGQVRYDGTWNGIHMGRGLT